MPRKKKKSPSGADRDEGLPTDVPSENAAPVGRPSLFKPEYIEQAAKLCLLGATDIEIARFFGICVDTLNNWKIKYPDFVASIKTAKGEADERVERSLYQKATGYTFESEKIFQYDGRVVRAKTIEHVPPSDTAMIFWLKNRRPEQWRDIQKHEVGKPGDFENINNSADLRARLIAEAETLGQRDLAIALAGGPGASGSKPH